MPLPLKQGSQTNKNELMQRKRSSYSKYSVEDHMNMISSSTKKLKEPRLSTDLRNNSSLASNSRQHVMEP